jgi:hypothetical protein
LLKEGKMKSFEITVATDMSSSDAAEFTLVSSVPARPSMKQLCEEQWASGHLNSARHKAGWRIRSDFFGTPVALIVNERKIPKYKGKRDDRYTKTALEMYRRMISRPDK